MPRCVVPMASPLGLAFDQPVFFQVPWKDHMSPIANYEVLAHGHSAGHQLIDFAQDAGRVEHHAAGDRRIGRRVAGCRWE